MYTYYYTVRITALHKCILARKKFDNTYSILSTKVTQSKFFIMSMEFDKNISDRRHDCTDYKNELDFLRLVKWPKIAVKKATFFRNFRNKSRSILMLHKIGKNKKCAPKLIFFNKKYF